MKARSNKWGARFVLGIIAVIFMVSFALAQGSPYDKAIEAYAKKDFTTAVKYLKEYVSQKPDARSYYLLGYACYKIKNMEESAKYFREAYLIDPAFDPKTIKFEKK